MQGTTLVTGLFQNIIQQRNADDLVSGHQDAFPVRANSVNLTVQDIDFACRL